MRKMNKRGFTLIEVLTVIIVITVIMMISLPLISSLSKRNNEELYHSYERMIEEYVIASNLKHSGRIMLNEIDGLDQIKSQCDGFIDITEGNPPIYEPYIKCGNKYETENYSNKYYPTITS